MTTKTPVRSRLMLPTASSAAKKRDLKVSAPVQTSRSRAPTAGGGGGEGGEEVRKKVWGRKVEGAGGGGGGGGVEVLADQIVNFVLTSSTALKTPSRRASHTTLPKSQRNQTTSTTLTSMEDPLKALGKEAFKTRAEILRTPVGVRKSRSSPSLTSPTTINSSHKTPRERVRFDVTPPKPARAANNSDFHGVETPRGMGWGSFSARKTPGRTPYSGGETPFRGGETPCKGGETPFRDLGGGGEGDLF
ncbi:hypothetical protein HK097_006665, partial [Rhizophlyctis rosea]